ncbi:GNAT family N-acetyltransferase [Muriicola sp. Z0-33]|uniref:GNAT family N-acetyltransferase n=1 Tax=Muriicola sp. Z0-33 TaxID=2816957 RepID=UPI0022386D6C|nr:GNAT family N-acetyltransferase [Muriicola sp. Z0-33]MCW5515612.1 GNAT family N-acetyltransferase [Muriicola sp. Z0-33]
MELETVTIIRDKNEWESVLKEFDTFDFYHTYDYHNISKAEGEIPELLVYRQDECLIALPLLVRRVFDTKYFDATSVYGYAGPLSKNLGEDFDNSAFHTYFDNYLRSQNIISVFSRLNPYIDGQEAVLKNIGKFRTIQNIVNIDLTLSLDEQRSQYRRDTRSRVNKARRLFRVVKATTPEEIEAFISIYTETMEKLNASESYFFDKSYFFEFLECEDFKTDILLAVHLETGDIGAATMFVKTNNIIQYHLSGTKSEYFKLAPSRLLLDEMRLQGTEQGYTFFNLGGGYQSPEDALFAFKSSFSNNLKTWNVWTYIADQQVYDELAKEVDVADEEFFPKYRAK